ncbi:hypothetical protein BXZ70DRAFT_738215 [Cristinia sonorae]|uniref:Uncharacterized protein n=1 Tax=Cristinia sonorae TaxID=1940300 RepID=A0A8K0UUG7_9AGAR|nr:hypothetical protein BXZ70DRAFT_738215 [Cristinia sonorae]
MVSNHLRPKLYIDTDMASYSIFAQDAMTKTADLHAPPNTPVITQMGSITTNDVASRDSLDSLYSNSPLIFGNSLPWAIASLELEHRLSAEAEDAYDVNTSDDSTDSTSTSPTSLLNEELYSVYEVEKFIRPTHITTRALIRPLGKKSAPGPFSFLRSAPTPVAQPNTPATSRPTSPIPRPVSPLVGALKALKLITDAMVFEEDLDFYEHRWAMEQAGKARVEIGVRRQVTVTVQYTVQEGHGEEQEDEVVYPRRRLPNFFEQVKVSARRL